MCEGGGRGGGEVGGEGGEVLTLQRQEQYECRRVKEGVWGAFHSSAQTQKKKRKKKEKKSVVKILTVDGD